MVDYGKRLQKAVSMTEILIVLFINLLTIAAGFGILRSLPDQELKAMALLATIEVLVGQWIAYGIIHFVIKFW